MQPNRDKNLTLLRSGASCSTKHGNRKRKSGNNPEEGDEMATQSSNIETMRTQSNKRGSEKLMRAWKERRLSDESVREIAEALDRSPATVEGVEVFGGENATGVRLSLSYTGDDGPWCGNDILFWLQWLRKHGSSGGVIQTPHILINGITWPEIVQLELSFGNVENTATRSSLPGVATGVAVGE
jgi:hypothetical protein